VTRRSPTYGLAQRTPGMGVLRLRGTIRSVVLDLVGTSGIFTDEAATVPASVGQAVAAWRDESRPTMISTQGTAGFRPTATADGLTFDGSDDRLAGTGTPIRDIPRNIAALTIYAVATPADTSGVRVVCVWSEFNTANTRIRFSIESGKYSLSARRVDGGTLTIIDGGTVAANVPVVAAGVLSFATRTMMLYANGVLVASNTAAFDAAGMAQDVRSGLFVVGASVSGTFGNFVGDIRRIQAYHAAHSPSTVAAITAELAAQHGVTL